MVKMVLTNNMIMKAIIIVTLMVEHTMMFEFSEISLINDWAWRTNFIIHLWDNNFSDYWSWLINFLDSLLSDFWSWNNNLSLDLSDFWLDNNFTLNHCGFWLELYLSGHLSDFWLWLINLSDNLLDLWLNNDLSDNFSDLWSWLINLLDNLSSDLLLDWLDILLSNII